MNSGLLTSGQRAAEAQMTLMMAAYAPGAPTTDADGMKTAGWTPKGPVPGKVSGQSSKASDTSTRYVTVAGVERPVLQGGLSVSISATVPEVGWEYVVTAVGRSDDPALKGRRYHVVSVPAKSFATARRLDVVEVPGL